MADKLYDIGYWVHLLENKNYSNSQPADIIGIKGNETLVIDCKTLKNETGNFTLERLEENQILCFNKLKECGYRNYALAILYNNDVYFVPLIDVDLKSKSINVKNFPIIFENFYKI